jgi:hypothetical protein
VRQEWNDVTLESTWDVSELEPVPEDFPLERTHRAVHGVDASEVAKRISNALCLLSIEAEYDNVKAKAKCRTTDLVSFRIRLFAGGEGGLPVVVEVQRRSGSASHFMRTCRTILDAAEGVKVESKVAPPRKTLPPFMKKGPVANMKCLQSVVTEADPVAEAVAGVDRSIELLRAKYKDTNILGLENLCLLTDPLKTRPDVAIMVCKSVILGDPSSEIREEIAVMLQKDAFLPEEYDNDDDIPLTNRKGSRYLALVLLSNCLALTCKDGSLTAGIKNQKWFGEFLIPSLVDEVKSFRNSANNAYEASCSLTSLATCSDYAKKLMNENGAVEELELAHAYGLGHHDLLACEAARCLTQLGKDM